MRPLKLLPLLLVSSSLLACAAGGASKAQGEPEAPPQAAEVSGGQQARASSPGGTVRSESFHSAALGVDKSYWLYLPVGYESSQRSYPVIYMLHGLGGQEDNWVRYMGLASAADAMALQAIVVMPDGDDSFYVNGVTVPDYQACLQSTRPFGKAISMASYCVKSANYEDYIARDLVKHIDTSYRTIADRKARAIGGLSMGGYGALFLAMKHSEVFSSVASHSGVASLLYAGPFPYEKGKTQLAEDIISFTKGLGNFGDLFLKIYGPDLSTWQASDPAILAKELVDGRLAIYFDCGTEDEFRLHNGAAYLDEVLTAAGIAHTFELAPGHHDVSFWSERIAKSLTFHSSHFSAN